MSPSTAARRRCMRKGRQRSSENLRRTACRQSVRHMRVYSGGGEATTRRKHGNAHEIQINDGNSARWISIAVGNKRDAWTHASTVSQQRPDAPSACHRLRAHPSRRCSGNRTALGGCDKAGLLVVSGFIRSENHRWMTFEYQVSRTMVRTAK